MKRSEINRYIRKAEDFFAGKQFLLPPFASWTPREWAGKGHDADEIRRKSLGWDLTDFGSGDFRNLGLLLFTIRNGDVSLPDDPKVYAEKIMVVEEQQVTPFHLHWVKTEDIINRGGGNLILELAWSTEDERGFEDRAVRVSMDGVARKFVPCEKVTLAPGESITLPPLLYHKFYGESDRGTVMVGEVSRLNDDTNDNGFLEALGRFPDIEEDEPPYRLLCNAYPEAS